MGRGGTMVMARYMTVHARHAHDRALPAASLKPALKDKLNLPYPPFSKPSHLTLPLFMLSFIKPGAVSSSLTYPVFPGCPTEPKGRDLKWLYRERRSNCSQGWVVAQLVEHR